jgi:hypothetical protein
VFGARGEHRRPSPPVTYRQPGWHLYVAGALVLPETAPQGARPRRCAWAPTAALGVLTGADRSLLGRRCRGVNASLRTFATKYQPAEQQHVEPDDERTDCRNGIANDPSRVHKSDADRENDRAYDPSPNLKAGAFCTF